MALNDDELDDDDDEQLLRFRLTYRTDLNTDSKVNLIAHIIGFEVWCYKTALCARLLLDSFIEPHCLLPCSLSHTKSRTNQKDGYNVAATTSILLTHPWAPELLPYMVHICCCRPRIFANDDSPSPLHQFQSLAYHSLGNFGFMPR